MVGETVFRTDWFSIEAVRCEPEWGLGDKPYYVMRSPDNVLVVPVRRDGSVVMVRQFRPAIGRITLEFPAGQVEPGEAPERAAARELVEESGYGGRLVRLGSSWLALHRDSSAYHCFAALDAEPITDAAEAGIDLVVMSMAEFRAHMDTACDSLALLGVAAMAARNLGDAFPFFHF